MKKQMFFTMHISAMVPSDGPVGTSRASNRMKLVGLEHAPTETSRPLSPRRDYCGRLQSFGAARPWLRLSLGLGPTVLGHTHTAVTVGVPCWHSVPVGLLVSFVLGQYFTIVVIMRIHHRHRTNVRNYMNCYIHQQFHLPATPHRHKRHPVTHHHGRGLCKCMFLLAFYRQTHP